MASIQDQAKIESEQDHPLLPSPIPASRLGHTDVSNRHLVRRPLRGLPFPLFILYLLLPLLLIMALITWFVYPVAESATITVTAQQRSIQQQIEVAAVPGTPTPGQIQARVISATATQKTPTPISATGRANIPQLAAHGKVTFYNLAPYSQTVALHTILTASNGVQIETLAQAVVPQASGSPLVMGQATVPAQATQAGTIGNLPVHAVTMTCCANDGTITARNELAFTGGQDAQNYTLVQQSDIDLAAASLAQQAIQQAKAALSTQLTNDEQGVESQNCTTQVTAPPAGTRAVTVSVSVTATCHEEVYSRDAARHQAINAFVQLAQRMLGPSYQLWRQPSTGIIQTHLQKQRLLLIFQIQGSFRYQLDQATLRHLVPQLVGKSWKEAQTLLLRQPGVERATFSGRFDTTLPSDASQIMINIG